MYDDYGNRGFQPLTLMIDGDIADWVADHGVTYPILNDNDRTIWDIYGGMYIPLNMVLDQNFVIRYWKEGFYHSEIVDILESYLPPP